MNTNKGKQATTKVWDLPTRVFHWALVLLIAAQFASGEFGLLPMVWHYWLGYTTLALIVFRVGWGFVGSSSARFSQFLRGPAAVFRYARALARGEPIAAEPGHNPLGGWSVLAMLVCVFVQTVSGLFANDDISESGPLADRVSDRAVSLMTAIHGFNRWILLGLIALHLCAVLYHAIARGENLIGALWHGRKRGIEGDVRFAPRWRAVVLLAIAAAAVAAVVYFGAVTDSGADTSG